MSAHSSDARKLLPCPRRPSHPVVSSEERVTSASVAGAALGRMCRKRRRRRCGGTGWRYMDELKESETENFWALTGTPAMRGAQHCSMRRCAECARVTRPDPSVGHGGVCAFGQGKARRSDHVQSKRKRTIGRTRQAERRCALRTVELKWHRGCVKLVVESLHIGTRTERCGCQAEAVTSGQAEALGAATLLPCALKDGRCVCNARGRSAA